MTTTFLKTDSDLNWLREVHLTGMELPVFKSVILFGNEDYPDRIELYLSDDPDFTDQPVMVIEPDNA